MRPLPSLIFASRWLQLPLYLGLIAAQAVYVFHFWVELVHLLEAAFGNQHALQALVSSIGYKADAPGADLSNAWRDSKGHSWRILFIVIAVGATRGLLGLASAGAMVACLAVAAIGADAIAGRSPSRCRAAR